MAADRLFRSVANRLAGDDRVLPDEGRLASFERATSWINSEPLSPAGLRGRMVLVDFWTYTCVNWLRTAPYLRAWSAKYADAGLTVIGVHTPEFGFEGDLPNVVRHTKELGIEYPVAVDSDYGVWNDFANHYWPALYLADATGRVRYHHYGEGEYPMTEMAIQQLLVESGSTGFDTGLVSVAPEGLEVAADWETLRSPETYVGYGQSSGFASEDRALYDRAHDYVAHGSLRLNEWDLSGDWTVARHAAVLGAAGGAISFAFHARDANLVMGPGSAVGGTAVGGIPFRVLLDGRPVDDARGTDVLADSTGVVNTPGTYQLVRQHGPIEDRVLTLEFDAPGVEAYCFTFG